MQQLCYLTFVPVNLRVLIPILDDYTKADFHYLFVLQQRAPETHVAVPQQQYTAQGNQMLLSPVISYTHSLSIFSSLRRK